MGYVVRYEVEWHGEQVAGPYESREEALNHLRDILGFDGVTGCRIETVQPMVEPSPPAYLTCSECGFGQYRDRRTGDWYAAADWDATAAPSGDDGVLRFQCCPKHAEQAATYLAPFGLEGFSMWTDRDHELEPDHVVAATKLELQAAPASMIREFACEDPEPAPMDLASLLDGAIGESLAMHRAAPLQWESFSEFLERARIPESGEWQYRPRVDPVKKEALRSAIGSLADALLKADGAPQRCLEDFMRSMRSLRSLTPSANAVTAPRAPEPPASVPVGVAGLAALENRDVFGAIRSGINSKLEGVQLSKLQEDLCSEIESHVRSQLDTLLGEVRFLRQLTFRNMGNSFSRKVRMEQCCVVAELPESDSVRVVLKRVGDGVQTSLDGAVEDLGGGGFQVDLSAVHPSNEGRYRLLFQGDNESVVHYLFYQNGVWSSV